MVIVANCAETDAFPESINVDLAEGVTILMDTLSVMVDESNIDRQVLSLVHKGDAKGLLGLLAPPMGVSGGGGKTRVSS